jgi:hypothetical protein
VNQSGHLWWVEREQNGGGVRREEEIFNWKLCINTRKSSISTTLSWCERWSVTHECSKRSLSIGLGGVGGRAVVTEGSRSNAAR